jgi:DAACS family dicarboxylate/amino acid:cation (Na+ or H+) symporter
MSRRLPLHTRMLIGFSIGIVAGLVAHRYFAGDPRLVWFLSHVSQPVGKVFLRLLFMLVVPLIFSALVLGITGLGDLKSLGRIGLKTLAYTVVVSSIAVLLGLVLVNVLKPGEGLSDETRARMMAGAAERSAVLAKASAPKSGIDLVTEIVPANPLKAAVDGDLLAWMFFALLFGIGLSLTRTEAARRLEETIEGLYDVTMRLIGVVIGLAPVGVAALLFSITADLGLEIVVQLARYVGVVVLALAILQFVVYWRGEAPRRHEPAPLLPRCARGDDHRLLDRLVERHPAHRPARRGGDSSCRRTSAVSC